MYTDPSGWTYRYVSEEDKNAWYQGAEFYNTINNLNNRYGGGGGGASGVGGPGQGGNGTGLNGVYYDWVSGTYRSVFTEQEVSGPVFCPTDFLAHYSGKAAENFVAGYQNYLRGSYTITLTDAGPGVKLDGWRGTLMAIGGIPDRKSASPTTAIIPDGALESQRNILFLDNALKFEGAAYKKGGMSEEVGFDCTGLVCKSMGFDSHIWLANGTPPGCYAVTVNKSSYTNFLGGLNRGDILSWTGQHAGFYAGNGQIFHAHATGKPVESQNLNIYTTYFGYYPNVYRQIGY